MMNLLAILVLVAVTVVDIPIDTVHRGDPGDLFLEGTLPANPGDQCAAVLEARNNRSVHPDSDLLVGPVTFADIESGSFKSAGLSFVATGPVDVYVRLGGDGKFSAGFTLEVTCSPPQGTTTTSSTTTTFPSSSTSTAPPVPTTGTTPPATTTTLGPTVPTEPPATSCPTGTTLQGEGCTPVGAPDTGGGACAVNGCDPDILRYFGAFAIWAGAVLFAAAGYNWWLTRKDDE